MASGKAEIRGHRSLFERLIVPRPITQIFLVLACGGIAHVLWLWLDASLLAYLSGISASFCLLCMSAIWGMRDKADSALAGDYLDADQFRKARRIANALRRRSIWRAAIVALCALAASSPVVSLQFAHAVWHWMVLACGAAVGVSTYSFLLANAWEEQLRAHRDREIESVKRAAERRALMDRIEPTTRTSSPEAHEWSGVSGSLTGARDVH